MRYLLLSLAASIAVVTAPANASGSERYSGIYWLYRWDGTDATLFGRSEKLGRFATDDAHPSISFTVKCSKDWVRFSVAGNGVPKDTGKGMGNIVIDGDTVLSWQDDGDRIAVVTASDPKPNKALVREIFEGTAAFYAMDAANLTLRFPKWRIDTVVQANEGVFDHRDEVAKFRERCASWWMK